MKSLLKSTEHFWTSSKTQVKCKHTCWVHNKAMKNINNPLKIESDTSRKLKSSKKWHAKPNNQTNSIQNMKKWHTST